MSHSVDETVEPHTYLPDHRRRGLFEALIVAMRPKQWAKNLLLFAALLFTIDKHHQAVDIIRACAAFAVFCLLSSSGYLLNDAMDVQIDRMHPRKRSRPIAAGDISPRTALIVAFVIAVGALTGGFAVGLKFGLCALTYLLLTVSYSLRLKHVVILDLLVLASGFVLRAVGGAWAIPVPISPWLVLCTLLLALFLAISKRRGELVAVSRGRKQGRPILSEYSAAMLDQMSTIVTSALLMSYALYTIQSDAAHSHNFLLASIPFVIYGIFRYLYLIHRHDMGETPDEILMKDRPLLVCVVLWALVTGLIIAHPWAP
ncbi:MAG TPA: decaprenyl-phosphate phosphoribosyltransferase [Capsulimonadaceae bacterium]|jgi:4-hydroxybenzoate polyprenyltransferase